MREKKPRIFSPGSITLYVNGADTLALFQCEHPDWRAIFLALDGQDWSWGRYERDADIPATIWHQREQDWKRAMGGNAHWIPSQRGVRFCYSPLPPSPSPEAVAKLAPSPMDRARAIAREILAHEAAQHLQNPQEAMHAIAKALGDRAGIDQRARALVSRLPMLTPALLRPTDIAP